MRSAENRIAALEKAGGGHLPRFRIVVADTAYADDTQADADQKVREAIAADRAVTGWNGEYIVFKPVSTCTRSGEWVAPGANRNMQSLRTAEEMSLWNR